MHLIKKEWVQSQKKLIKSFLMLILLGVLLFGMEARLPAGDLQTKWTGMLLYWLISAIIIFNQGHPLLTEEYEKETMSFLTTKPLSISKILSVKLLVGSVQAVLLAIVPFYTVRFFMIQKDFLDALSCGLITAALALASLGIIAFSLTLRFGLKNKLSKRIMALLVFLIVSVLLSFNLIQNDPALLSTVVIHSILNKIALTGLVTFIVSTALFFTMAKFRRMDFIIRKTSNFIHSFLIVGIVYYIIDALLCLLVKSPVLDMFRVGFCIPMFLLKNHSGQNLITTSMLSITLLLSIGFAAYVYNDSRTRYSRRATSLFFTFFTFLFSLGGLLTYMYSRNTGQMVQCTHCGHNKLLKIHPCPCCKKGLF